MNRRLLIALLASALAALSLAPLARADFGLSPGYTAALSSPQAGAHGDLLLSFAFNSHPDPELTLVPDASVRALVTRLPAGTVGNPQAVPQCSAEFLRTNSYCPAATQVGVIRYTIARHEEPPVTLAAPIYNMVAQNGRVAELAFQNRYVVTPQVHILASVRTGEDYGISAEIPRLPGNLKILDSRVEIWGVPADPSHDAERGAAFQNGSGDPHGCLGISGESVGLCPSAIPLRPFLTNPTRCDSADSVAISIDSYEDPGDLLTYLGVPQRMEGCDKLEFHPSITVQPTNEEADTPTGLAVDLSLPQNESPRQLATAELKKAVTTLPEGMTINPAAADGLGACSEAQIGLHNSAAPACPDSSKIGTVEVESNLLAQPLHGFAYQAQQGANPFGSLLAFYVAVEGSGVRVKLPAKLSVDPRTGRLTASFDENPQLPFTHFKLNFDGGPHAPLLNPPTCATYTTTAQLTPYSAADPQDPAPGEIAQVEDSFQITSGPGGSPCPPGLAGRPFQPRLEAGTTNPIAGAFSPFSLRLTREDGAQRLTGLSATLPPGLLGRLAGIPYCPDSTLAAIPTTEGSAAAQIANPSCPAASQLGIVTVGAGAGPDPFFLQTGRAYLAGPYKGAPLSLAIITPALAGPFDLGNVVVRTALQVDPESTRITAVSDPLPQILDGIPLDLRDVRVNMNRSDFTLNPTSCDPMSVGGTVSGSEGATAQVSSRFQVGDCARLAFKPKLALKLTGGTKRNKNPALRATLTYPKGNNANIASAQVTLPHSAFLDQAHIRTVCTRVQFAADQCPAGSIYGHARAITPLLDKPLEGPVYLRSSSHKLPDLVAALDGQIDVVLAGKIDTGKGGGIRNTFQMVPDAPVSKFVLEMQGGKKGLLVNSENICSHTQKALAHFVGQNGKVDNFSPTIANSCKAKHKRHGSHH